MSRLEELTKNNKRLEELTELITQEKEQVKYQNKTIRILRTKIQTSWWMAWSQIWTWWKRTNWWFFWIVLYLV